MAEEPRGEEPEREGEPRRERPRRGRERGGRRERPAPAEDVPDPEPALEPVGQGMPPIAAAAPTGGNLVFDADNEAYVFTAGRVNYRIWVGREVGGLLVVDGRVDDGEWEPLLTEAGIFYRAAEGGVLGPVAARELVEVVEFRHAWRGRILTLRYTERGEEQTLKRTLILRLVGRSLSLAVAAAGTHALRNYAGFTLGAIAPGGRRVDVPGAMDPLFGLPGGGFFSAYLDRRLGNATAAPDGGAFYRPNTEGRILPVSETFYLTLSPDPLEPLADVPATPGPHLGELARRLVLDFWSEAPYAEDAENLEQLERYGIRDLALVYRNWQRFGYRRRPPCLYPANDARGSNEQFRALVEQVTRRGWLCALPEEYASITPDSPYWDPKVVAKASDGHPRPGHDGGYAVAADRMLEFARLETTKIARNFRPNAAYADRHVGWNPEEGLHQVDSDAGSRHARSMAAAIRATASLLTFLRDIHGGPLLGEGGAGAERFDSQWAGLVDAAERPLDGGAEAPLVVDYELRHLNPVMPGFGVGLYRNFFGSEVDPDTTDWDAYRAREVALGRLGYLGSYGLRPKNPLCWAPLGATDRAISEYFLLRALQECSLASPVVEIAYRVEGELVPLAEALRRGADLTRVQVWRRHASGLEVWVNTEARTAWRVRAGRNDYELPPNGWLAWAPDGSLLAYSALVVGNRVDVCLCSDYSFLDVRGDVARRIEGITTDGAVALIRRPDLPRREVVLVGGRTLTVEDEQYRLSERADVNFRVPSEAEVEIAVLASESGKPVLVGFPAYSPAWQEGPWTVTEWLEGDWRRTSAQVQPTKTGAQLGRARPGGRFRVRLGG